MNSHKDSIVDEVRAARAAIAAEFEYDLARYLAWVREETRRRQEEGARQRGAGAASGKSGTMSPRGRKTGAAASG
jgi:hypothetical protein